MLQVPCMLSMVYCIINKCVSTWQAWFIALSTSVWPHVAKIHKHDIIDTCKHIMRPCSGWHTHTHRRLPYFPLPHRVIPRQEGGQRSRHVVRGILRSGAACPCWRLRIQNLQLFVDEALPAQHRSPEQCFHLEGSQPPVHFACAPPITRQRGCAKRAREGLCSKVLQMGSTLSKTTPHAFTYLDHCVAPNSLPGVARPSRG